MTSSTANAGRPARPCTEYNIFFQLERARILQVTLGADPSLGSLAPFRPSQPTYAGLPPLPDRYASLALPYDWHLPGKEARRGRKHRRTHGAIGFHDLSDRIAAAWREADDDVRRYCARVAKAGVIKYRAAMREWKRNGGGDGAGPPGSRPKGAALNVKPSLKKRAAKKAAPDRVVDRIVVGRSGPPFVPEAIRSNAAAREEKARDGHLLDEDALRGLWRAQDETSLLDQFFASGADGVPSLEHEARDDIAPRSSSIVSNSTVDMPDDEIMGMWRRRASVAAPGPAGVVALHEFAGGVGSLIPEQVYCQEITTYPPAMPLKPLSSEIATFSSSMPLEPLSSGDGDTRKGADPHDMAFGRKGYDKTMEEVLRLKSVLDRQVKEMEGTCRPMGRRNSIVKTILEGRREEMKGARHPMRRRNSIVACSA